MLEPLSPWALLMLAVTVDLLFGEVPARVHPVVWTGKLARGFVRRAPREGRRGLWAGALLAAFLPIVMVGGASMLIQLLEPIPPLKNLVALWLLTSCFAIRMLAEEARRIAHDLEEGRLCRAREHLSHLCSRDARNLDPGEVAGAVVESVAENTSDSIIAPIFWYCLLGIPGAMLFRTMNTLDGMIGYRGEFERLGKVAARTDDFLCWIPARLTGACFVVVGRLAGGRGLAAMRVLLRDRCLTSSPNAGYPMAAMAGSLGVCLRKRGEYALGEGGRNPEQGDIARSLRVLWTTVGISIPCAVTVLTFLEGGR